MSTGSASSSATFGLWFTSGAEISSPDGVPEQPVYTGHHGALLNGRDAFGKNKRCQTTRQKEQNPDEKRGWVCVEIGEVRQDEAGHLNDRKHKPPRQKMPPTDG